MKSYFSSAIFTDKANHDESRQEMIARTIHAAIKAKCTSATYYWQIGSDSEKKWYVAAGWKLQKNEKKKKELCLCFKLAYLPEGCITKDYSRDFTQPYDEETGNVWNTEISTFAKEKESDIQLDLSWLIQEFDEMVAESHFEQEMKKVALAV